MWIILTRISFHRISTTFVKYVLKLPIKSLKSSLRRKYNENSKKKKKVYDSFIHRMWRYAKENVIWMSWGAIKYKVKYSDTHYDINPVNTTAEPNLMPVCRFKRILLISSHCILHISHLEWITAQIFSLSVLFMYIKKYN